MIMNEMIRIVRVQNNRSIVFFSVQGLLLFTLKWEMSKQKIPNLEQKES